MPDHCGRLRALWASVHRRSLSIDSCANVLPGGDPSPGTSQLFTGDNTGGTFPGDAVAGSSMASGSFPLVWHSFMLQDCGNVVIDYCGNTPLQSVVSAALITTCPADDR
jgi:hypothetical protein